MKKYPIKFTDNYIQYEEWANDNKDESIKKFYKNIIKNNPNKLAMCKKWQNKAITLAELEELMDEFIEVLFNGKRIMIVNGDLD